MKISLIILSKTFSSAEHLVRITIGRGYKVKNGYKVINFG